MRLTSNQLVDHLYYNKLPQVYRDEDKALKTLPLYRYLTALSEGGFTDALDEATNILDLVDPEKCPEKCLPVFFKCFGLEYCEDIPVSVQRKLLMNVGEINKRRGTHACVEYLVRVLTNLDSEQQYTRLANRERQLWVTLFARDLSALRNMSASIKIVENYIRWFIPYYIVPIIIDSRLATQHVDSVRSRACTVYANLEYEIKPREYV